MAERLSKCKNMGIEHIKKIKYEIPINRKKKQITNILCLSEENVHYGCFWCKNP